MSWLRRAWAWLVAALGGVVLALTLLWRRAARQRNEARLERDAARASAERERNVTAESDAIREAVRGKRVEVDSALHDEVARIESRPKPTHTDDVVRELNRRLAERRRSGGR